MSARSSWRDRRFAERTRAGGKCEHCGAPLGYARFYVVRNGAGYLVLCAADCCRHFAPARLAKARARRHRHQLETAS